MAPRSADRPVLSRTSRCVFSTYGQRCRADLGTAARERSHSNPAGTGLTAPFRGALSCVYASRPTRTGRRTVNNTSKSARQSDGSIVPFLPGGAEGSGFLSASTLDVMEVHRDLRKFMSAGAVAQSRGVLSSGRDARGVEHHHRVTTQRPEVGTAWQSRSAAGTDREIDNVKRLTLGVGIESLMRLGSDQTAAEALQVAETEVGVRRRVDRGADAAVRAAGQTYRSTETVIALGLTA
jgi:hypothetical protein